MVYGQHENNGSGENMITPSLTPTGDLKIRVLGRNASTSATNKKMTIQTPVNGEKRINLYGSADEDEGDNSNSGGRGRGRSPA